jgi:CheY-like chemotaxis protein
MPQRSERDSGRNSRVLVAVDDPADRLLIAEVLRLINPSPEFHFVADGEELLARLGGPNDLPDIILLDLHLPRMSGCDVLQAIKRDARLASIRVIVLTDSTRKQDLSDAYQAGAAAYIVKPTATASFAAALSMALGRSARRPAK